MNRPQPSRTLSLIACALVYLAAFAAACGTGAALGGRHPILVAAAGDLAATVAVFAASAAFNNSSLYDPYWSLAPLPIAFFWLSQAPPEVGPAGPGFPALTLRRTVALALLLLWAVRLTGNWARRWQGLGHEDWRYADLRPTAGKAYWLVSFLGFHLFPTVLVFLGCLSLYPALAEAGRPFRGLDAAAAALTAGAIWIEARADRELRLFRRSGAGPQAVLDTGLWSLSRHPNYFGEVLFWWGLYLFALAADAAWWRAAVGPAAITLLFLLVSVPMMERHMLARHPGYAGLRRGRSAFVPWFRRSGWRG